MTNDTNRAEKATRTGKSKRDRSLGERIRTHIKWRWDIHVVKPCRRLRHWLSPSVAERYRLERLVGPVGWWDELRAYQIGFVRRMGLEPQHRMLDIGCGPLQGGIPFMTHLAADRYVGIDARAHVLDEAYRLIAKEKLSCKNPRLILSTRFGRDELERGRFDFIWISQLLYHFDPALLRECMEAVAFHLAPGGRCYCDIIGYPNVIEPDTEWDGYRFHLHTLEFMAEEGRRAGLAMKHIGKAGDFGYPREIALHTNDLLEFTRL